MMNRVFLVLSTGLVLLSLIFLNSAQITYASHCDGSCQDTPACGGQLRTCTASQTCKADECTPGTPGFFCYSDATCPHCTVNANCPSGNFCSGLQQCRRYSYQDTCSSGNCVSDPGTYTVDDTCTSLCPAGQTCSGGTCVLSDPCAGVTCNSPPSATCANSITVRTYSSPGTCSGGTCSYSYTDTTCSSGNFCSNVQQCRRFSYQDTCSGGSCVSDPGTYTTDNTCTNLCSAGQTCSGGTCVSTVPTCSAPTIPVDSSIRCQSVTSSQIGFGWNAVTGSTGYRIEWCPFGTPFGSPSCGGADTGLGALYTATGLSSSTTYDFRVRVRTSDGSCTVPSAWSSTGSCTTSGGDITPPTRSNGAPIGYVTSSSTTLSLTTNEGATCRYSTTAGVSYDSMTNTFSTIDGTSHSRALSGLSDGSKTYYVKCRDSAGNKNTDDYPISFTVDTTPPEGTAGGSYIRINNDDTYTSSVSVTLNLNCVDASGCSQMKIANNLFDPNGIPSATAEAYVTSKSWTLPAGDGVKAVYAIFRDNAGNWMPNNAAIADIITLDTTLPTVTITSPASGSSVASPFTLSADTNEASTCRYATSDISYDSMTSTTTASGTSHSWSVSDTTGSKTYYVKCRDGAGNVGYNSVSFTVSSAIPQGPVTLYEKQDYSGSFLDMSSDIPDLRTNNFNDKARSLKVQSGMIATLYRNIDYGGFCGAYLSDSMIVSDSYSLTGDLPSSVRVTTFSGAHIRSYSTPTGIFINAQYFPVGDSNVRCIDGKPDVVTLSQNYITTIYFTDQYTCFTTQTSTSSFPSAQDLRMVRVDSSFRGAILNKDSPASSDRAEYYPEGNYGDLGNNCVGKFPNAFGFKEDSISSFVLVPNYLTVVYDNDNFNTGNGFRVFSSGQSNLNDVGWNDRISSFRVCTKDSTTCVPNTEDSTAPSIQAFTWDTPSPIPLQVATGGSITFGVRATDNYWVSKCELIVSGTDSATLLMSVISQTETGFEGSRSYTFNNAGSYSVKTRCYDLAGNPQDSLPVEVQASTSICGTCTSPTSLGTLNNFGDTIPISPKPTCSLSAGGNDIFSFTVNTAGYLITTIDGPNPCDWDFWVNNAGYCGSEITYAMRSGTGVACDETVASSSTVTTGSKYVKVHSNSGDGTGSISVKLIECIQNSDCTNPSKPYCETVSNRCVECLTDTNCVSAGKTCNAQGFPNRYAKCANPTNRPSNPTYTCDVCGGCDFNSDCTGGSCCPYEGPTTTGRVGPGKTTDRQCYPTSAYTPDPRYLCTAS